MSIKERVNAISRNDNVDMNTPYTTAKIELSGICTLNCAFCYNKKMIENNERQKLMTEADFDIVLNALESMKTVKEVGLFYMGESGVHPLLAQFYKALKDRGFFTYLTTNGTVTENVIEAIPYIDSLKVSWNYKDEKDFEAKTNKGEHVYHAIIKNIGLLSKECQKHGKVLTVSTILDSDKDDYKDALAKLSYGDHYWLPLQTQGGTHDTGAAGVVGEYENKVSPVPCWSLFKGFYVDVDLNVRCCCYGHSKDHILGSLKEETCEEILCSEKNSKIKEQQLKNIIPSVCKKCLNK
jgi:pyruvate-formate lyase-activating enzyme